MKIMVSGRYRLLAGRNDTNSVARGMAVPRRPVTVTVPYRPEGTGSASDGMLRRRQIPRQGDDCGSGERHTVDMATKSQVVVYQVDASGGTGARVGTGSLIHPLFVLVHPPLSLQLADQPHETKLRLGIGSLADDGGVIEVIDTYEIDVYEHDGVPLVAAGLARPSAAAFGLVLPDGAETGEADLAQALMTCLSETGPPEAAAPTAPPEDRPGHPGGPEPRPLPCKLFPWLCHHKKK
jgi:hypothetical protein